MKQKIAVSLLLLLCGCSLVPKTIFKQVPVICPPKKITIPCELVPEDLTIYNSAKQAYDHAKYINKQCWIAVDTRDKAYDVCVEELNND